MALLVLSQKLDAAPGIGLNGFAPPASLPEQID
jgi:hypothetical protein